MKFGFTVFGLLVAGFFGLLQAPGGLGYPVGQTPLMEMFGYASVYAFLGAMVGFIIDVCRKPTTSTSVDAPGETWLPSPTKEIEKRQAEAQRQRQYDDEHIY